MAEVYPGDAAPCQGQIQGRENVNESTVGMGADFPFPPRTLLKGTVLPEG